MSDAEGLNTLTEQNHSRFVCGPVTFKIVQVVPTAARVTSSTARADWRCAADSEFWSCQISASLAARSAV